MKELRIHGRGGQGAVMASEILVQALLAEGKYGAAIPAFGFERRGAPVQAFVRLDNEPILEKTQVYAPHCVVVMDATLLKSVDVYAGLGGDGVVLLNRKTPPAALPASVRRLALVDATGIATAELGRPIVNTTILGALAAATGWVGLAAVTDAIRSFFQGFLHVDVDGNVQAARRAYAETRLHPVGGTGVAS